MTFRVGDKVRRISNNYISSFMKPGMIYIISSIHYNDITVEGSDRIWYADNFQKVCDTEGKIVVYFVPMEKTFYCIPLKNWEGWNPNIKAAFPVVAIVEWEEGMGIDTEASGQAKQ